MRPAVLDEMLQLLTDPGPGSLHLPFHEPGKQSDWTMQFECRVDAHDGAVIADALHAPSVDRAGDEARHAVHRLVFERHARRLEPRESFFDDACLDRPDRRM